MGKKIDPYLVSTMRGAITNDSQNKTRKPAALPRSLEELNKLLKLEDDPKPDTKG